jgi:hypothetical protein
MASLLNSTVDSADPLDRTSLELERDLTLHMLDRENKLILKIRKPLEKSKTRLLEFAKSAVRKLISSGLN